MSQYISKILGITILLGSFVGGWLLMDLQSFMDSPLTLGDQPKHYVIDPGMSLTQLANDFKKKGLLEHPTYLVWYARWKGMAQQIKAGEYELSPGLTAQQLVEKIVAGDVIQYSLSLIEGWTFKQLMDAINQDDKLEHTLSNHDHDAIMAALGRSGLHPEGRFYPDTYHLNEGMTDLAFLQRAFNAMEQRLSVEWQQRANGLPYSAPYDALIMASIIEKETAAAAEREQISGVFVRRLFKNMRLQTDPTVIYGLGERFDGNLRKRDLKLFTQYNTYLKKGLPPTPIAMPGGDAIHAALHPAPGDSLYFVARGDGTHQFSDTVEEHNQAVAKYQLGRRMRSSK